MISSEIMGHAGPVPSPGEFFNRLLRGGGGFVAVQGFPHLGGQERGGERLLQQSDARLEHPLMQEGVLGVGGCK